MRPSIGGERSKRRSCKRWQHGAAGAAQQRRWTGMTSSCEVPLGASLDLEIALEQHVQGEQKGSVQVPQLFLTDYESEAAASNR
ncbi:unnamed protein product, partial [Symbiodinium natans]